MAVDLNLPCAPLKNIFSEIKDVDGDKKFSTGDVFVNEKGKNFVVTEADSLEPEMFLQAATGRQINIISTASLNAAYLVYSEQESEDFSGMINMDTGETIDRQFFGYFYASPDYAELITRHDAARERCEQLLGPKKRRSCLDKSDDRAAALFKSAQEYDVLLSAFNDAWNKLDVLRSSLQAYNPSENGLAAAENLSQAHAKLEVAAKEFYLSQLDMDFRPE